MPEYSGIDQFHDPSFRTLNLRLREVGQDVQGLIKTADVHPAVIAELPDTAFAWMSERLYPLHTPAHASLSYLYATSKTASAPEHVVKALSDALEVYGVNKDAFAPVAEKVAAATVHNYLLPEMKRWDVISKDHVKHAEEALTVHGHELSVMDKTQAACTLVKLAAEYGAELQPATYASAGMVVSDIDTTRHWVAVRADIAPEGYRPIYEKIASELASLEGVSYDRPALIKLANTIMELDTASGLSAKYGRKLPDPMETVFNTDKIAESLVTIAGVNYPVSKLAMISPDIYSDVFGEDVMAEMTTNGKMDPEKVATIIDTMPLDLKRIFVKQTQNY